MPHLSIAILQFPGATNFCCILCGASNGVATNSFRLNGFFAGQLTVTPPLPTPTIGQVQAIAKTAAAAAATFNGRLPPSKSNGKTFRSLLATLKGISRLAALKPKTAKFSFFPHPTPYPLAALLLSFFFSSLFNVVFFFFLLPSPLISMLASCEQSLCCNSTILHLKTAAHLCQQGGGDGKRGGS